MARRRTLAICTAALAALTLAAPAGAAPCDGSAIGARFAEASRLCGGAGRVSTNVSATPVPASPAGVAVAIGDRGFTGAPVSVTMPGYRQRLNAAVRQVRQAGPAPSDALITAVGRRYRIDPHLLASMMSAESGGRMTAVSNKGALGLMQVMPGTARSLGVTDPRRLLSDRVLAVSTGAAYLKKLQAQFGNNVPLVVAAYNAGPGAVVKYRGVPRYRETQGYVGRVMSGYLTRRYGTSR